MLALGLRAAGGDDVADSAPFSFQRSDQAIAQVGDQARVGERRW
jgi:hypothetical protein